jgi:hypothetical protein
MVARGVDGVGEGMMVAGAPAAQFSVLGPIDTPIVSASVIGAGTSLRVLVKVYMVCSSRFETEADHVRSFFWRCC